MDHSKIKYLVVPDVHGRQFWFKPVDEALAAGVHVIFLGDYLDPYPQEEIYSDEAVALFEDLLNIKRDHPDLVHLLIGNHDLHYIDGSRRGCRMDYECDFIENY